MKKRLLLQFLAVWCVAVGAYAVEAGDYIFSTSAKYKVLGPNVFQGGDFGNDYANYWTNEAGGALDNTTWGVQVGAGVNGANAMVSKAANSTEGSYLTRVQALPAGFYTVSYWVKASATMTTSVAVASDYKPSAGNYMDIYLNKDGLVSRENATQIAAQVNYSTDWKQVVFNVNADADTYLIVCVANIAEGTAFSNFEVYNVEEVFDTRKADRLLEYAEKLLAEEVFPNEKDYLTGQIEYFKGALADRSASESADIMEPLIEGLAADIEYYLSANAGNVVGVHDENGNAVERYLYDWQNWSYANWNNVTTRNTWYFTGGRWGFAPNVDPEYDENGAITNSTYLERPFSDGYVASAGIQRNYTLDVGLQIVDSTLLNTSLKPGKYMFSIEAQAVAAANTAAPYGSNEGITIQGPKMWVGKDSVTFEDVVLNNTNWQRLYHIAEIHEGEDINAGFHFPVTEGNVGGRYSLRNPEFRVVGLTQDQVDHLYAYDQLQVQQDALKNRLQWAREDIAKGIADGYPWGHAILQDSISKFQAVYDDLITVVDENGNELNAERVTLAYKDEILAAVRAMNSARSNYSNTNKVYQKLVSDVAWCNESLNDASHASGDKATFQAVIAKAQAMIDAVQYDVDEGEAFTTMDDELLTAKEEFEKGTASRANPADLDHSLINGDFTAWGTGETNLNGNQTSNGWNFTCGADLTRWEGRDDSRYESGRKISAWRGTTAGPNGKVQQTITLTTPGLYEYRAKAYGTDDSFTQYMAIAAVVQFMDLETFDSQALDTLYNPNIRLFFGENGSTTDSLALYKCAPATGSYDRYQPLTYSIFFEKTTAEPLEVELGLESAGNTATVGANGFGFGDNHLYYVGSKAAYETAIKADLQTEFAAARAFADAHLNDTIAVVRDLCRRIYRHMGDAEPYASVTNEISTWGNNWRVEGTELTKADWITAPADMTIQQMQNAIHSVKELVEMITTLTADPSTGINAVAADDQVRKAVQEGVYTLTGVRIQANDVKSLPRGLYIVNGKKVVVK